MSTSPNLPVGAFITTLGGKRCTAVPRTVVSSTQATTSTSTSTSSSSSSSSTTSSFSPSSSYSSYLASSSSSSSSSASSSPSSLSTSTSASEAQVLEPPQVQMTTAAPLTVATSVEATTSSTSIAQSSTISSSTDTIASITVVSQPQASVADTSIAVLSTSVTAALATAPTTTSASLFMVATPSQSELASSSDTTVLAGTSTTVGLGLGTTSSSAQGLYSADATASGVTDVPASGIGSSSNYGSRSAIALAGGVIGGLAFAGLLAFLIWFWRRRMQKRRSTLLTPLTADPSLGKEEKEGYVIQRDSIGPTPFSTQVKAAVRLQYNRIRGRNSRSVSSVRDDKDMTNQGRIMKVWAALGGPPRRGRWWNKNKNDTFATRGSIKEREDPRSRTNTNKPSLFTKGGELDSEAQRRQLSRTRGTSVGTALGGLDLNFSEDPFNDVNATTHISANPPPLFATGANNPFSDANAIGRRAYMPTPSTYIADIRHSRGQSVDSAFAPNRSMNLRAVDNTSRPPSGSTAAYADSSIYLRDSASSFDTRRNKFRSDPFDLEPLSQPSNMYGRPAMGTSGLSTIGSAYIRRIPSTNSERYRQDMSTTDGVLVGQGGGLSLPVPAAYTRYNSLGSSRYTSGVSEGTVDNWPAPGPDLGPRAL
ncbi:hypothetical protein VM1G_07891 [Cytospora mali]|uniref:Uncharacterized protein n=1 Tax=Cytospora mali TaxID=578113 RepID=A0A194W6Q3_CYTMA|nr:hypothetical protein VM1G_07891 [Valsa mali]